MEMRRLIGFKHPVSWPIIIQESPTAYLSDVVNFTLKGKESGEVKSYRHSFIFSTWSKRKPSKSIKVEDLRSELSMTHTSFRRSNALPAKLED